MFMFTSNNYNYLLYQIVFEKYILVTIVTC